VSNVFLKKRRKDEKEKRKRIEISYGK